MRHIYLLFLAFPALLFGQSSTAPSLAAQGDPSGKDYWIAPNPADDYLSIHKAFNLSGKVTISVYNIVGRRLYNFTPETAGESIILHEEVTGWIPGTYLVRIESDGLVLKTIRFVKR